MVNLYSKVSATKGTVSSQMESLLASLMGAQDPHHELKVPFKKTPLMGVDPL
jgi:hypothetical protein